MEWWESALAGIVGGAGTVAVVELSKYGYRARRRKRFTLERHSGTNWALKYHGNPKRFLRPEVILQPLAGEQRSVQFLGTSAGLNAEPDTSVAVRWVDSGEHQAITTIHEGDRFLEFDEEKKPRRRLHLS
jgi:hypothetical protein